MEVQDRGTGLSWPLTGLPSELLLPDFDLSGLEAVAVCCVKINVIRTLPLLLGCGLRQRGNNPGCVQLGKEDNPAN